jgi:DNA ligase-1
MHPAIELTPRVEQTYLVSISWSSTMPDLAEGQSIEVQGSAAKPYILKNVGGVYSCSCPAWRNQSVGIERRTCKHLRKLRGDQAEQERIGQALPVRVEPAESASSVPALLLAQNWTNDVDLAGWWMSEKLDGVRAYWDGQQFLSRQGNRFYAPAWFTAGLPDWPLDGELWMARKAFQRTVSIVRRQDECDLWRELRFVVFDAPQANGVFEDRIRYLQDCLADVSSPFVRALEHQRCRDEAHLRKELAVIESLGGEGLMLRQPGSSYEAGRSATLLKVKTFHDAEARVIEHLAGAGRHKGRLGALLVELPDGTSFSVGTGFSDAQRENPPAVGSTITFRYQELSDRGVPRFPSFVRVRPGVNSHGSITTAASPTNTKRAAPTSSPTTQEITNMARRFEFVEGSSAKFWEVSASGKDVTVRFGRLGATGQTQTKSLPDPAAAQRHVEKLVAEKTGKGYVETRSN